MFSTFQVVALSMFCVFIIVLIKAMMTTLEPKRDPPGPNGWPLIGALGKIDFLNVANEFLRLRRKYGDIFSFSVFRRRIVVLCGVKTIREVLTKHYDAVNDRGEGFAIDNPHGYGILDSSGEYHKAMREFVTKSFRDFSFEKRNLATIVKDETMSLLEKMREKNGRPFNVNDDLVLCIANVICSFALGQKILNKDAALMKALEETETVVSHPLRFLPVFISEPVLKLVPGDPFGVWIRERSTNDVIQFLKEFLDEHKKSFDPTYERDLIDVYLNLQNEKGCRIFSAVLIRTFMGNVSEKRIPPGPKGWPLIGVLGKIDFSNLEDEFFAYRRKYGDVFSFCILNKRIVVLCGAKAIREVLNKHLDAVSVRADGFAVDNPNGYGIIDSSGEYHKAIREFTTKSFRELGFEKKGLEVIVKEQILNLLERLREKQGRPFSIHGDLVVFIANVVFSFVIAKKFQIDDAALSKAVKENDVVVSDTLRFLPIFIPERLLKLVPGDPFRVWLRKKNTKEAIQFIHGYLEEHKRTYDPSHERDFIDAFLNMQKIKGSKIFSDDNLLRSIYDLFLAGTETSVSTIKWCILLLLHHPGIQSKMREEIESTIGRTQMPTIDHRPLLPYCEAVILEVQRHRNLSPFSIPRLVTSDIEYEDVVIPKDSILFPFLFSAALDEKVFPNPEKFDPNNFLDENGQLTGQNRIVPFSTGKRVCIGEHVAKMELFLFIVSIVQNFQLLPEDPHNLPSLEGIVGGVFVPKPFKFKAVVIE